MTKLPVLTAAQMIRGLGSIANAMVPMKTIIFIQNAVDRLKERGISPEAVEETIGNPDYLDFGDEKRRVAQKLIGGKLLRVIYEDEKDAIVVISAYSTSKIQKYLR